MYSYSGTVIGNMKKQATEICNNIEAFQKYFVVKTARHRRVRFHIYECLGKTKRRADQWFPGTGGGEWQLITKRPEGTFWNDGNVLYLDCGGEHTGIYFFQNC